MTEAVRTAAEPGGGAGRLRRATERPKISVYGYTGPSIGLSVRPKEEMEPEKEGCDGNA